MSFISAAEIKEKTTGKWTNILLCLGIESNYLTGKHTACPVCGGKDRFRFDNKKNTGTYYCSHCGAGDGFTLLQKIFNCNFNEVCQKIMPIVGSLSINDKAPSEKDNKKLNAEAVSFWKGAAKVVSNDPVSKYLTNRLGEIDIPPSLRCGMTSGNPLMAAIVQDEKGAPVSCHRTFLTRDGKKADLPNPKRLMAGSISSHNGVCIRLSPVSKVLGIAEGIETALAASKIHNIPSWSAINATLLEKWTPPEGVEEVVIFADNDANGRGQKAAFTLHCKLYDMGIKVSVKIPDQIDTDWADAL